MRRSQTAPPRARSVLSAPTPTESGIYPIGVFSDVESHLSAPEVEETLESFAELGARLRGR